MKLFLSSILFILTVSSSFGQRNIWQYGFQIENIDVRADTAYQMFVTELELPTDGHVIAKIEGIYEVSKGDNIILAVSNHKNWLSNFGNVGTGSTDSIYTAHNFQHTMVYSVEKGRQPFYALAHNWTDRDGTGFTSVTGKMTLEFIPLKDTTEHTFFNRLNLYPLAITEMENPVDTLEVIMEEAGDLKLVFDGRIYSNPNDEITIRMRPLDTSSPETMSSFHFVSHERLPSFSMNEQIALPAGVHKFVLTAQKTQGNTSSQNNALYGTFYATVYSESEENVRSEVHHFENEIIQYNKAHPLKNIQLDIPSNGKLLVRISGQSDINLNDQLIIRSVVSQTHWEEENSDQFWTTLPDEKYTYFSKNMLFNVTEGSVSIDILSFMNGGDGNSIPASIHGDITLTFIADPVISSSLDPEKNNVQNWFLYPNPTRDIVSLKSVNNSNLVESITLMNSMGAVISHFVQKEQKIDLSSLASGLYILSIKSGEHIENHKIFKAE